MIRISHTRGRERIRLDAVENAGMPVRGESYAIKKDREVLHWIAEIWCLEHWSWITVALSKHSRLILRFHCTRRQGCHWLVGDLGHVRHAFERRLSARRHMAGCM